MDPKAWNEVTKNHCFINVVIICSLRLRDKPGVPTKLYLILRLNFGAVHFSVTKMLVLPDSRDMYKSFRTLSVYF